jgi:hypothetical protein
MPIKNTKLNGSSLNNDDYYFLTASQNLGKGKEFQNGRVTDSRARKLVDKNYSFSI